MIDSIVVPDTLTAQPPFNVYLCQVNYATGAGKYKGYWLPYSVGSIWAYVEQFENIKRNYQLKGIIFKRDIIEKVLMQIENPHVVGFSSYVWNHEYNLRLAKTIKETYPNCRIIFGGPQIPKENYDSFLKNHPFIDIITLGEGEENFKKILEDILNKKTQNVYSFHRLDKLDIPSPYEAGVFNQIIKENPDIIWNAVLETNRGCPFKCTYCDWGSLIYTKIKQFPLKKIFSELRWFGQHKVGYLSIADANFGVFKDRDLEITEEIVKVQKEYSYPETIDTAWYKNLTQDVLTIVKKFIHNGFNRGVSLSLQSLNQDTLTAIERNNMQINQFKDILDICNTEQIPSYTELILGLPFETKETWKRGLCDLIAAGQHNSIETWTTQVLKNSALNNQREVHGLKTVFLKNYYTSQKSNDEEAVDELAEIVCETKYMSFADLIDSWMFSWMIVNLHVYGWTQIVSIYLHKNKHKSYYDFYNELFDELGQGDSPISEEFQKVKGRISLYLSGKSTVKFSGQTLIWESQEFFQKNKSRIFQSLEYFFYKCLERVDDVVLKKDILFLQHNFVTQFNANTINIQTSYNIFEHLFKNCTLNKGEFKYVLKIKENYDNEQDYYNKFYFKRRSGWGKYKIEYLQ